MLLSVHRNSAELTQRVNPNPGTNLPGDKQTTLVNPVYLYTPL